ncbi:MAG: caspase family protein [Candidatus Fermentibacteraceae bacterium]|nr:caspase family protein [Candidatus Fermentibacteraceae bacterium]
MLFILPAVLLSVVLPDPGDIQTLTAGEEAVVDLSSGEGWVRILEDDYVCLSVSSPERMDMAAYDESGNILCTAGPGSGMVLSAFSDYWFYISLRPSEPAVGTAVLRVDTVGPSAISFGEELDGIVGRNAMARTFTFTPESAGRWTFRLEGTGGTDLDLEVYGTGMRLWGSSMSLEGFETVTVSMLPAETAIVVVSRYGKSGTGEFLLSAEPSGRFQSVGPMGEHGTISSGEMHRFMIPEHDSMYFFDLTILTPGADIDLLLHDAAGEYLMGSQSYSSVESLLLYPSREAVVADVLLFDPGTGDAADYVISTREPGVLERTLPVMKTVGLGPGTSQPVGFSPPAGGLFRVSAVFDKTRDGDVRVWRGEGEPVLTFASLRGDEDFLIYIAAGDTVWIDPYFSAPDTQGDAQVTVSPADARVLDHASTGRITSENPDAFYTVSAEAGTILDIGLSGGDRDVDLDMYVTGPGLDLVAEGWLSAVDAAGDEAVEVYAEEDAEYGVTVYLYERSGETTYDLEVNRIRRTGLADPSPLPETWAISAGISGYPSSADVLNRASMDAVEFYEFLTVDQGIPEDHVILLVDAMSTVDEFTGGMAALLERAGREDRVVVFYSGHGDRSHPGSGGPEEADSANEYLCLYDGDVSDDMVAGLVDSLARAPVFLFFDACHSGGFVNDFSPGSGVMVLTAAREDLSVSERILTPILLRGSRGDADADGNGYVSALELMTYIDERLQLICPECDAELTANTYVCPQCGALLKGENAVPRPEQGMFLTEDLELWKVP